jgi:hypothetical protein
VNCIFDVAIYDWINCLYRSKESVTRAAGLPLMEKSFSRGQAGAGRLSLISTMRAIRGVFMKCLGGAGVGVELSGRWWGGACP